MSRINPSLFSSHIKKHCFIIGFKETETIPNDRAVFHEGKWVLSGSVMMSLNKEDFQQVDKVTELH
ncbi:hypothetical protein ACFL08_04130 [Patescibacteria group bacterium]